MIGNRISPKFPKDLDASSLLSAFFHSIPPSRDHQNRLDDSRLINVIWDRICRALTTSCGVVRWYEFASPPPPPPSHRRRSGRGSGDAHDWKVAFLLAASDQSVGKGEVR